eukprot:315100-Chlamydomonas_euryale.AAC.4
MFPLQNQIMAHLPNWQNGQWVNWSSSFGRSLEPVAGCFALNDVSNSGHPAHKNSPTGFLSQGSHCAHSGLFEPLATVPQLKTLGSLPRSYCQASTQWVRASAW